MKVPALPFRGLPQGQIRERAQATRRPFWVEALHVVALFDIVIAQPILSRDSNHAWVFVTDRAQPLDLFILVALLCLVLPAVVIGIEAGLQLISQRVRNLFHALVIGSLLFAFAHQVISRLWTVTPASFVVMWVIAVLGGMLYLSLLPMQQFVTYLSVAILVIPGNFFLRTSVAGLVFPSSEPSASSLTVRNPVPVVMLVFDELPLVSLENSDHAIDSNLFPNFARFARGANWYRNATTVADYTFHAVPSILTGRFADSSSLATSQEHPQNLFTLLGGVYDEKVSEPVTHLCPQQICPELKPSFSDRAETVMRNLMGPTIPSAVVTSDRVDSFPPFIESIRASAAPTLYFEHIVIPHAPWNRLPDGTIYTTDTTIYGLNSDDTWQGDDWLIEQAYQRHLVQVEYADMLLGQMIDRLEAEGIYDDALVVVVADHGTTFTSDTERRAFDADEAADIMPVPLMIKVPHQRAGVVNDENVQTIDILPSIADVLGVELPKKVDGRSLFDPNSIVPSVKTFISAEGRKYEFGSRLDGIDTAIQHKESLFGAHPMPDDLYRIGQYQSVLGEEEEALEAQKIDEFGYKLDDDDLLNSVDLDSDFVPALIRGQLVGDVSLSDDTFLAIAVNGKVEAVTRPFDYESTAKFLAMVPESALRNGSNVVDVFVVSGPDSSPSLTRLVQQQ